MRTKIGFILLCAVMAMIGLATAVGLHRVDDMRDDLARANADRTSMRAELDQQQEASTALADQVRGLGEEPVVEPEALPSAGSPGADGKDGIAGKNGEPGKDGLDGKPGPPGKTGPAGAEGAAGADGSDGEPGPAGPPGAKGDPGPAGADGKDGALGAAGANGKDGRSVDSVSCSGSLGTFTFTYSDGTTQTVQCTPAAGE